MAALVSRPPENAIPTRWPTGRLCRIVGTKEILLRDPNILRLRLPVADCDRNGRSADLFQEGRIEPPAVLEVLESGEAIPASREIGDRESAICRGTCCLNPSRLWRPVVRVFREHHDRVGRGGLAGD